jgi:hypothetical protein
MQFDRQRAFPHPVLRPDVDDYTDGDFQVTVDFRPDASDMAISAHFQYALSVPEIISGIRAGNASFAVVVSCRETYYREVLFGQNHSIDYRFLGGSLRGEVETNPYVVCTKKIDCYYSELYPYPAKAGSATVAGRRRTRAAPAGMAPAVSWS